MVNFQLVNHEEFGLMCPVKTSSYNPENTYHRDNHKTLKPLFSTQEKLDIVYGSSEAKKLSFFIRISRKKKEDNMKHYLYNTNRKLPFIHKINDLCSPILGQNYTKFPPPPQNEDNS